MRKWVYNAAALVLVVLGGLIAWVSLRSREPVYGGKPLTLWLSTYAPTSSSQLHSQAWNEADDAVRHMGTNCFPVLLSMIPQKDSQAKLWVVAFARKHGLTKRIHIVPATTRNVEASRAFIALGEIGKDAVPALVKTYDDNISAESRSAIEDALGWIGPAAKPAIPLLLGAATNSDSKVRADALWALGEIHAEPELCFPWLIHALNDLDDGVRLSAAHALGRFGPEGKSAVPSLLGLTNAASTLKGRILTTRMQVTLEAISALKKIDPPIVAPTSGTFFDNGTPAQDSLTSPR